MIRLFTLSGILTLITFMGAAADQGALDQIVSAAKAACLQGSGFTFEAKMSGDIVFGKTRPTAEADLRSNIRGESVAPGLIAQQIKVVASQQIGDCMRPYLDKVAELILGQASGAEITRSDAATALDLGDCPESPSNLFYDETQRTKTFMCSCPAQLGPGGSVWGSSVYNLSSNICITAIHGGAIARGTEAQVLLHWAPSPPVFRGTTQNGVTSHAQPAPSASGAFVIAPVK